MSDYISNLQWSELAYYLIDGFCNGSIFALIALGYTMVYGIIKLINFAHGEFFMVGAYAGFGAWLLLFEHLPLLLIIPIVLLVSGLAGSTIAISTERIAYKPIRNSSRLIALLTAIGVSLVLQNLFKFVNKGQKLKFTGEFADLANHKVLIAGQNIPTIKFFFVITVIVLMLLLWYLVMKTAFGRAMRATSQDLDAARLMGINVDRIILYTFAIGGFFAGIAGILQGLIYTIQPMMGFTPGIIAFVAAVVGGIGSIPGAVLGGILIGVLQNTILWLGVPGSYKDVCVYILLVIILVFRPQGILGKAEIEKV